HVLILLIKIFFNQKIIIRLSNYLGYNKYEKKIYKFFVNLFKINIYRFFSYKIICPSKELSLILKQKYNLKNIWIPNAIEDFLIKKSFKEIKNKKISLWNITSVGRLTIQKNHQLTILAISKLINHYKINNLRLRILGDGELKQDLLFMIRKLKLQKYVKLVGNCNPVNLLNKSDIFIASSLYEGMPNSLLEMICYKKVIISTKCKTGPREVLKNGKFGLLIEQNDSDLLASTIFKVIRNYKWYQKKFEIDPKHIKNYHSDSVFKKYENLIK
ncbi:glycosyltransferase, partial [Candidatus Pelagibacter sp. HIMB1709]|uniref:glycosyltransferase n=1 Tax=Candidatus Pelagibacter sp. HIMB1709 TaxID=3413367 RepID=UPI003F848173